MARLGGSRWAAGLLFVLQCLAERGPPPPPLPGVFYHVVQSFPQVDENVRVDSHVHSHRWKRHSESLKSVSTNRASMGQDSLEPGGFTDLLLEDGHDNTTDIEGNSHKTWIVHSRNTV